MSLLVYKSVCAIQAISLITSATMMFFWPFRFAEHALIDPVAATPAFMEACKVCGILYMVLGCHAYAATHYHSKKASNFSRINVIYSLVAGIFYGFMHSSSSVFRWQFALTSAIASAIFGVAFLYMALTLPRTKESHSSAKHPPKRKRDD